VISLAAATGRAGRRAFLRAPIDIYRDHPQHRDTERDIVETMLGGRSAFHRHAEVHPYLIRDGERLAGRVALIHDRNLPDYAQVSFFEALPGLEGVIDTLRDKARELFQGVPKLVCGLDGHLNYSAGILIEGFEMPPVFGFNWNPLYYADYFAALHARTMVSFRFEIEPFCKLAERLATTNRRGNVVVRTMDRRQMRREVEIFSKLNNACFQEHAYWSDRTGEEDYELLRPFRFLLREENLIFAEVNGDPVGFLLWYPDFNEMVAPHGRLGLRHVCRYRLRKPANNSIQTVRLTEIGVRKEHRGSAVVPAMILEMVTSLRAGPYRFCEGGFIFEENTSSIALALSLIARALGRRPLPARRWATFEGDLQ